MKKILLIAIAIFAFSFTSNAQTSVVKINPLGMVFGYFNASYETLVTESSSVEVGGGFMSILGYTGYNVSGKYKIYFLESQEAPRGLYAAPVLGYSGLSGKNYNGGGFLTAGAIAGYQFIFGGGDTGFALDLNAGLKYSAIKTSVAGLGGGVGATFGLSIGYAF